MKITKIEVFRFSISMIPFGIATGVMDRAQNILIRVHTDTGLYGLGECSAFPMIVGETQETGWVLSRDFAKIWLGKDALDIAARMGELHRYIAGNSTIKSAFDMALYDLSAKHAGKPLYAFLGGAPKEVITDITIGLNPAEKMAEQALEYQQKGASILKIKLGDQADKDIERVRKIRAAVGSDMKLRLDANQGWDFEQAQYVLNTLSDQDIQFCEQPMRTYNDYKLPELKALSPIAIMADESCYDHHNAARLIENNACTYLNIKLSKSSGIEEALRIHEVAQQHQMECMIGGMLESRIALSAKLHLAYACPYIRFFDLDTCMVGHLEDPATEGVQYDGFTLSISDRPGIGAEVDESYLKKCESQVFS